MKIVLSVVLAVLIVGCSNEKGSQKSAQEVQAPQSVKETVSSVKETAPSKPVAVEVNTTAADITKKTETTVAKAKKTTVAQVKEAMKVDGAKLFTACSSCHGTHAEKKALGKSQIIKGWSEAKIITALKGYKDGTYGGAMKAVMKGQAAKLSDADIKALAEYISQL